MKTRYMCDYGVRVCVHVESSEHRCAGILGLNTGGNILTSCQSLN